MNRIPLFAPRYRKLLLFLGIGLAVAGLVAGGVTGLWWPLPVLLLLVGLILAAVGATSFESVSLDWLERRSTRAGTDALVATLAVLAILGLLNFLAVRYPTRIDLTENKLFTLSPQSQQLVASLEEPLKVWLFEPNPTLADRELLANYRRENPEFDYEFVDPQIEVGLAEQFDVQFRGEVYLEYDGRQQLVQTLRENEPLSEAQLTNGIEQILRDRQLAVYFLQGHGELPLEPIEGGLFQAVSRLEESGFLVEPLNLPDAGEIPEAAAAVIIASPDRALLPGEIDELRDYLDAGGGLLVMLDPDSDTSLFRLLGDWGVEIDDERLVVDMSGRGSIAGLGPATPLITRYGSHPITIEFEDGVSVFPLAQPVLIDEDVTDPDSERLAVPLAIAPEDMWAERDIDDEGSLEFDPDRDRAGPLNLGVAVAEAPPDEDEDEDTDADNLDETAADELEDAELELQPRLVVFGNARFATNGWFDQQLNGDLFLNAVQWLAKEDEAALAIRPRAPEERRIELSQQQAALLGWLALLILPACGFISAGVLWWLRR